MTDKENSACNALKQLSMAAFMAETSGEEMGSAQTSVPKVALGPRVSSPVGQPLLPLSPRAPTIYLICSCLVVPEGSGQQSVEGCLSFCSQAEENRSCCCTSHFH